MAVATLVSSPAAAQTNYLSRSQQKKEVKNSLRDAKKVTSDYDESHLNVNAYNFRNGETGRKMKKAKRSEEMPINEDGTAMVKTKWFSKKGAPARARKN
jgi:DNA-binding ferritin-like protein (Dps family)